MKMKILPNFISSIKSKLFQPQVQIANYYTAGPVSNALYKLQSVQGVLESGAVHNGVSLTIDKASTIISDESLVSKELKTVLNKSIALNAVSNITGKRSTMLIDVTKDVYQASVPKKVTIPDGDNSTKQIKTEFHHEDNFYRAVFRTFDRLIETVNRK